MQIGHTTADGSQAYTHTVPQFGLGVFLMSKPGECKASVLAALAAGYTHIDTARAYANEHEVGQAIKEAGIERESLFITTKLRRGHAVGYEDTLEHCRTSLELLDTDYIDLYLVHALTRRLFLVLLPEVDRLPRVLVEKSNASQRSYLAGTFLSATCTSRVRTTRQTRHRATNTCGVLG